MYDYQDKLVDPANEGFTNIGTIPNPVSKTEFAKHKIKEMLVHQTRMWEDKKAKEADNLWQPWANQPVPEGVEFDMADLCPMCKTQPKQLLPHTLAIVQRKRVA